MNTMIFRRSLSPFAVVAFAFLFASVSFASTRVFRQDGKLIWVARDVEAGPAAGAPAAPNPPPDTLAQTATWQSPGDLETGGLLFTRSLTDNGRTDLVYDAWGQTTYVYEAFGNNDWHLVHQVSNPYGSYYTSLLGVGDPDNDGLTDFIYGSGTSGVPRDLIFMEARRPGTYPDSIVLHLPENNISTNYLKIADLDHDGRTDLIASTQGSAARTVAVWENRGNNAYTQVWSAYLGGYGAVAGETAVGDFDGDGRMEIVVPDNSVSYHSVVHVVKCLGPDTYAEVFHENTGLDNMYCVAGGVDLDRDGGQDFFVIGGSGFGTVTWTILMYESDGAGSYHRVWSYQDTSGWIQEGLAIGDVNMDGYPELLAQYGSKTVLFAYAGDNMLVPTWSYDGALIGQGGHRIVAPDLDRDGRNEAIWTTTTDPGTIVVYETTRNLAAAPWETAGAGGVAISLTASPNPFREATTLRYLLPDRSPAGVAIYDAAGRRVANLPIGAGASGGRGTIEWRPDGLPAGVYLARLSWGGRDLTRPIIRIR